MTSTTRMLFVLAAFLAVAGVATAQSACPECDEDGASNPDNTYHNADLGVLVNDTGALVDTDAAHSHEDDPKGFWAWMEICLNTFLVHVEEALGMDLGVDANAEVFASEDGVDADATLYVAGERVDFDESELGDLDGMTWEIASETKPFRDEMPGEIPRGTPDYEGFNIDTCLTGDVTVATCG